MAAREARGRTAHVAGTTVATCTGATAVAATSGKSAAATGAASATGTGVTADACRTRDRTTDATLPTVATRSTAGTVGLVAHREAVAAAPTGTRGSARATVAPSAPDEG